MFKDINWPDCSALRAEKDIAIIDVRSPGEYEQASIPGSINIPLFDNEERAEIGTLYTQVGVDAAKERGLEIVSAKLPAFVKQFAQIPQDKVVYCWRGGMRSRTTATVLSLMGIYTRRLDGGYRAYRQWVVGQLETMNFRPRSIVLQGHTGTGKTEILLRLKQDGFPVIDLEGMAGHRGSIFGGIGTRPNNQKNFDSLLLQDLIAYKDSPYVMFEAESKRIGKITVPDLLYAKRDAGSRMVIELPVEARVQQIMKDYRPWEHAEACLRAFQQIRSRIHTPIAAEIDGCLRTERYAPAVEMLLKHYYDPLYAHSSNLYEGEESNSVTIQAVSVDQAYASVKAMLLEER